MHGIRSELLVASPWRVITKLSIPAIIGQLMLGLYAFIDSIYVGQMVGVTEMSAVSSSAPFMLVNIGIAALIGIGSGSVLARAIGAKDKHTQNNIMGNLAVLSLLLSAITMAVCIPLAPQMLSWCGASGKILDMGAVYLRVAFCGSVFVIFMQSANMVLRAEGQMRLAMGFMVGGATLNAILDPIFILLLPGQGPMAVAIATVVSQVVQAIVTFVYFFKKSSGVRFHGLRLDPNLLPQIFSIGSSAMLMQVMMLVQITLMFNTAVRYGGLDQIPLMGAAQRLMMLFIVPIWGISQGMQSVIGTNFGANKYERVKKLTKAFSLYAFLLALLFFVVIQCFAYNLLALFITDVRIVMTGVPYIRSLYAAFPLYSLFTMFVTFFQALGAGTTAGLLVILRQVLLISPLILLLPRFFGVLGVWLSLPINDAIVFIIALSLMVIKYRRLGKTEPTKECI